MRLATHYAPALSAAAPITDITDITAVTAMLRSWC
jgi:hypothetical protein